jgi:sugar/nucleoside kinase (ribokinase family)
VEQSRATVAAFGYAVQDVIATCTELSELPDASPSRIEWRAGGAAANVAAWLAFCGVSTEFVGFVGTIRSARLSLKISAAAGSSSPPFAWVEHRACSV